jgi:hypothetical protein
MATKLVHYGKIVAETRMGDLVSIACESPGVRWHIWVNPTTLEISDDRLYKNPPRSVKHGEPGFFECRRLDASAKANQSLVFAMIEAAPAAIREFEKREAVERAEKEAKRQAAIRAYRIKESAPALLAALRGLFSEDGKHLDYTPDDVALARDTLAHVLEEA